MSATLPDRVQGAVLAGFLGSGTIALLNRLLGERRTGTAARRGAGSGEERGGDGAASTEERLSAIHPQYVYCAVRGDLIRTLGALMRRRDTFDHALVEVTGLAGSAPAVQSLVQDGSGGGSSARPDLAALATVVSAFHVSLQLDPSPSPLPPGGGNATPALCAGADLVLLGLGARRRALEEPIEEVLARPGRYHEVRDGLRVKEVVIGEGERRRRHVLCHVPAEEARQRAERAQLLLEIEAELRSLRRREGRLSSTPAPALLSSARYGRYLRETAGGGLRLDRAAIADAERYDGKWVVTSSDDTLAVEDLALGHERLLRVEACWLALRSLLRSGPIRQLHPWPTQTHLMMSVLALLLERVLEVRAGGAWRDLADALHAIEVVEATPDRAAARLAHSA